eukprot:2517152-Pleurochrysis_carterae.AAC.2
MTCLQTPHTCESATAGAAILLAHARACAGLATKQNSVQIAHFNEDSASFFSGCNGILFMGPKLNVWLLWHIKGLPRTLDLCHAFIVWLLWGLWGHPDAAGGQHLAGPSYQGQSCIQGGYAICPFHSSQSSQP